MVQHTHVHATSSGSLPNIVGHRKTKHNLSSLIHGSLSAPAKLEHGKKVEQCQDTDDGESSVGPELARDLEAINWPKMR